MLDLTTVRRSTPRREVNSASSSFLDRKTFCPKQTIINNHDNSMESSKGVVLFVGSFDSDKQVGTDTGVPFVGMHILSNIYRPFLTFNIIMGMS